MMPPHIVARLVAGEKTMSESHSAVTILFSDIVGWTHIASALPTAGVVRLLDHVFGIFDGLTAQHGVFKVETIGDAYMVAAGHAGEKDHAARCVRFGLAMLAACRATPAELLPGGLRLQIRVGVHTGPASVSFFLFAFGWWYKGPWIIFNIWQVLQLAGAHQARGHTSLPRVRVVGPRRAPIPAQL